MTNPQCAGDPIFEETLRHLLPHLHPEWGDRKPMDVFNRLLAKNVRAAGYTKHSHMDIAPSRICSRREQWGLIEFARLARGHLRAAGPFTRLDGPIVVVEYQGAMRLLDGNHRINTWLAKGDAEFHPVHIHTIQGAGRVIELPSAI